MRCKTCMFFVPEVLTMQDKFFLVELWIYLENTMEIDNFARLVACSKDTWVFQVLYDLPRVVIDHRNITKAQGPWLS